MIDLLQADRRQIGDAALDIVDRPQQVRRGEVLEAAMVAHHPREERTLLGDRLLRRRRLGNMDELRVGKGQRRAGRVRSRAGSPGPRPSRP